MYLFRISRTCSHFHNSLNHQLSEISQFDLFTLRLVEEENTGRKSKQKLQQWMYYITVMEQFAIQFMLKAPMFSLEVTLL